MKIALAGAFGNLGFEILKKLVLTNNEIVALDLKERETDKTILYTELKNLNERDKKIMVLRYGLYNNEEMTQKDVAELVGISQSYISRIEKKVIKRLKNMAKI